MGITLSEKTNILDTSYQGSSKSFGVHFTNLISAGVVKDPVNGGKEENQQEQNSSAAVEKAAAQRAAKDKECGCDSAKKEAEEQKKPPGKTQFKAQ